MKALWHARPMVLVLWGRDQPGVAARAMASGVADVVPREDASPERLRAAIDRVLKSDEMRAAAAELGGRVHATNPPAAAASLVDRLL
jgi:UDP:flavonoid glycosyltransferase YjiC (YdhE family)